MADELSSRARSNVTSDESRPTLPDDAPSPLESDQTIISSSPPLVTEPVAKGSLPQELARTLEGEQLGDIRLEEFVGGGGMGAVFRGTDIRLQRTVAVKVLATHHTSDADSLHRFQMEARSAARLDHPNIARVHYVDEERGVRFLVFEFIEGSNIRDLVNANGPFALEDALRLTLQVADALTHAWQRDVVHRDIKPSNILLTPEGQAKLVDMGLARFEDGPHDHDLTASGVTLGTFDYMAPEQARDSRFADVRSDIYSLGCTLFFMLAGRPPFPVGTALQKMLQHQSDDPPNLQQLRPDVPETVEELVETMLAKRPQDRFQSPPELLAALIAVTEQLGVSHSQVNLPVGWSLGPRRSTWLGRHAPWLVPAVTLVLIVFALGVYWHSHQPAAEFPELRLSAPPVEESSAAAGIVTSAEEHQLEPTDDTRPKESRQ